MIACRSQSVCKQHSFLGCRVPGLGFRDLPFHFMEFSRSLWFRVFGLRPTGVKGFWAQVCGIIVGIWLWTCTIYIYVYVYVEPWKPSGKIRQDCIVYVSYYHVHDRFHYHLIMIVHRLPKKGGTHANVSISEFEESIRKVTLCYSYVHCAPRDHFITTVSSFWQLFAMMESEMSTGMKNKPSPER